MLDSEQIIEAAAARLELAYTYGELDYAHRFDCARYAEILRDSYRRGDLAATSLEPDAVRKTVDELVTVLRRVYADRDVRVLLDHKLLARRVDAEYLESPLSTSFPTIELPPCVEDPDRPGMTYGLPTEPYDPYERPADPPGIDDDVRRLRSALVDRINVHYTPDVVRNAMGTRADVDATLGMMDEVDRSGEVLRLCDAYRFGGMDALLRAAIDREQNQRCVYGVPRPTDQPVTPPTDPLDDDEMAVVTDRLRAAGLRYPPTRDRAREILERRADPSTDHPKRYLRPATAAEAAAKRATDDARRETELRSFSATKVDLLAMLDAFAAMVYEHATDSMFARRNDRDLLIPLRQHAERRKAAAWMAAREALTSPAPPDAAQPARPAATQPTQPAAPQPAATQPGA